MARGEVVRGGGRALRHGAVRCQTRKWRFTHAHFCLSRLSRAAQEDPQHRGACGGAEPRLNSETTPHSGGVSVRGGSRTAPGT